MTTSAKNSRGFSIIETVIVVLLSSVVMLAVYEIYITFSKSYLYQNASMGVASAAGLYLNEFNKLGLQADAIVTSRTVSGTTYTTGSTTVVFEIPAINSSGDIVAAAYDYAIFYSTSTSIYRKLDVSGSSARVAGTKDYSDSLQNLTFNYNNASPTSANAVTADLTVQTTVKSQTFSSHLKQQVYLRNK